jgi:hypothetical protein
MNRIFQDVQNSQAMALLRPILESPVNPVYVGFSLLFAIGLTHAHFIG